MTCIGDQTLIPELGGKAYFSLVRKWLNKIGSIQALFLKRGQGNIYGIVSVLDFPYPTHMPLIPGTHLQSTVYAIRGKVNCSFFPPTLLFAGGEAC